MQEIKFTRQPILLWWKLIGKWEIHYQEQKGEERAEYGTGLLKELSNQITQDFGKGFTVVNLKNMRQFYLAEAVKSQWSTRQLERQINTFFL